MSGIKLRAVNKLEFLPQLAGGQMIRMGEPFIEMISRPSTEMLKAGHIGDDEGECMGKARWYSTPFMLTATKQSKWDMPEELLLILEKVEKESGPIAAPTNRLPPIPVAPQGTPAPVVNPMALPTNNVPQPGALNPLTGAMVRPGMPGPVTQPAQTPFQPPQIPARPTNPDEPVVPTNGFSTHEEAEKAFWYLLKKNSIGPDSSWENTMRAIITDPLYKSFNTMAERKESWQKYVDTLKNKEAEEKEARMNKQRPAIRNLLKGNPNVFHYTSFETADQLFAQHPIWQQ
ncbi:1844_t:CDS:2, partial [Acaulospora colombiana]